MVLAVKVAIIAENPLMRFASFFFKKGGGALFATMPNKQ